MYWLRAARLPYSGMRTSINYEKVIPSLCELYVFVDTLLPQQLNKQFNKNIAKCSERILNKMWFTLLNEDAKNIL